MPKDYDLTVEEHEDSHLRQLFWLCYVLDKDISLRTGRSPVIADQFCDLTLPEGYARNRFLPRQPRHGKNPLFPGDLTLSLLKSKVLQSLYSNASLRKSDAELLKTIRELDEELETWRTSIPEGLSPCLLRSKDNRLDVVMKMPRNMHLVELHLDYYYLLYTIHRASGRCTTKENGGPQQFSFGIQSSFDLSVEASRSTVVYLSVTANKLPGGAFW